MGIWFSHFDEANNELDKEIMAKLEKLMTVRSVVLSANSKNEQKQKNSKLLFIRHILTCNERSFR